MNSNYPSMKNMLNSSAKCQKNKFDYRINFIQKSTEENVSRQLPLEIQALSPEKDCQFPHKEYGNTRNHTLVISKYN